MSNWERGAPLLPEHYQMLDGEDYVWVQWKDGDYGDILTINQLCELGFGTEEGMEAAYKCDIYNVTIRPAVYYAEHQEHMRKYKAQPDSVKAEFRKLLGMPTLESKRRKREEGVVANG